jgi:hypothetical protein
MSLHGEADDQDEEESDPTAPFKSLNALEIAAVADAKRFLSQHIVQKIVTGIWNGDIIFWDSLSVKAEKKPRFYNPRTADPFSRLRVPRYLKAWEVLFFLVFLCLYYAVLVDKNMERITPTEIILYIWLAAFCYDELSEWIDAGSIFYAADIWNVFDMIMISIGFTFAILRRFSPALPSRRQPQLTRAQESLAYSTTTCGLLNSPSTSSPSRHCSWSPASAPSSVCRRTGARSSHACARWPRISSSSWCLS